MNKLEVNAAIWAMLEGENVEENAKTVIQYGDGLKVDSALSLTFINDNSNNDSITGETSHGQVQIQDVNHQQELIIHEFGTHKDRVGHFKMWKEDEHQIRFHHFWKSDPETQGADESEPTEYMIQYDEKLELTFFGERVETEFRFWFLAVTHAKFIPLYGTCEIDDTWGFRIRA